MATLILTAVGTAVGGPIGGAIGALIGQQADVALFAPKRRQGPRLGELAVQTSSYSTAIPKIFGRMRVAGTVIWATDLQERRSTSGGGKGQPKTTNYSYSASFAVALSARPVRAVRRIWADGKLLRGAAGDFKSRTKYRVYFGDEDQAADPLIASAEGIGNAPAFRGIAYAMFEDFELADYGNRIPSLTFEVVVEEGPVAIGAIAEELSGGVVAGGETPTVTGFAAGGNSVRAAIEPFSELMGLPLLEEAGRLRLTRAVAAPLDIAAGEEGAAARGSGGRTEMDRRASASVAGEVSVAYHDAERDYQTGLQRAGRGEGAVVEQNALAAVLTPSEAKAIAEARLAALLASRTSGKIFLPPRRAGLQPGQLLRLPGQAGTWRVSRKTIGAGGLVSLDLARLAAGSLAVVEADSGRASAPRDVRIGATTLRLLDLPLYGEPTDRVRLYAFAAGAEEGWRRAELTASFDGGVSWTAVGGTGAPAVIGRAVTVLGKAGSALTDLRSSVEIELLNEGMWLESRSDAALSAGANLAAIGEELVQFGMAEALGERRFRLSRLLRGRRGTEWASAGHGFGDDFVLIEVDCAAIVEPPAGFLGADLLLSASGVGDAVPVEARRFVTGETVRPPAPVHLQALRLANGDVAISWIRRSRGGWNWASGSDTPLGEEREAYLVEIRGAGAARTETVGEPGFLYGAADQDTDGNEGALQISARQLGRAASSRWTHISLP
ncbi:MAG TPA: phage tail protein [Allosphingosinicella sp.]|uniref:phage tail protein n=1 Tax=Allosphingosinicella sp. TaxID=2823234 RepID=UPI002EDB94C4